MTRFEVAESSAIAPTHFVVWCGGSHLDRFATQDEARQFLREYLVRGTDAFGEKVDYELASIWNRGASLDLRVAP